MGVALAPPVELGRAERNKLDKRRRIVDAARQLFREQGFAATTTSDIAAAANVGKGTLFFHATSKDGLLVMVFQEDIGAMVDVALGSVASGTLVEQLLGLFGTLHEGIAADRDLCAIFIKEVAFVGGDKQGIEDAMNPLLDGLADLVRGAQATGEIRPDIDPVLLTHNVFALFFFHLLTWLGTGDDAADQRSPTLAQMLNLQLAAARFVKET